MGRAYTAEERAALDAAGKKSPGYEVYNPITQKYEYYFERADWRAAIASYEAWQAGKTAQQVAAEKAAEEAAHEAQQAALEAQLTAQQTATSTTASGWSAFDSVKKQSSTSAGKELVFQFSGPLKGSIGTYVDKLVKLLGGKSAYIEEKTKLVVVM